MARWIGIAHMIRQAMCYWLLPISGIPIARTTIESITRVDLATEDVKNQLSAFDLEIDHKIRNQDVRTNAGQPTDCKLYREDVDGEEDPDDYYGQIPIDPKALQPDMDEIPNDVFNDLLLTEPILQRDGQSIRAKIIGQKRDENGN